MDATVNIHPNGILLKDYFEPSHQIQVTSHLIEAPIGPGSAKHNPHVRYLRAQAYLLMGDPIKAFADISRAVEDEKYGPDPKEYQRVKAIILMELGRSAEALKLLPLIIAGSEPSYTRPWNDHLFAWLIRTSSGKTALANEELKKALPQIKITSHELFARVYLGLEQLDSKEGQWLLRPGFTSDYDYLAYAYLLKKDHRKTKELLEKYVTTNIESEPNSRTLLAKVRLKQLSLY